MVDRALSVVCLDAMGVLYQSADDLREHLVPFVKARSARVDAEIHDVYRRCSSGEFASARLWELLGVSGDGAALDSQYLAAHRLADGALAFLERCRVRGLRVACISNDVSEWSVWLRRRFALDTAITPWVVSGDQRSRKPERLIYERLLTAIDVPAHDALVVDDRELNLDAARSMGFDTVLFGAPSARHQAANDFGQLTDLLFGATP